MAWDNVLGVAIVMGIFGLGILIVLWPGEKHGRRLLNRWGIDRPSDEDVTEAVRYLKRRRVAYPWLFVLLPVLGDVIGLTEDTPWTIVWTLLLGGLFGELVALRPAKTAQRQAMLTHRRVRDIIPAWALVLLGLAVGGGLTRYAVEGRWQAVAVVAGCGLIAAGIVALAVRRPAAGDPVVDLVLRARSAHVATGLTIAVPGALFQAEMSAATAGVFVLGLIALLAVVGPHRSVAAAAS
ncbi:hypothetical protein [Amycolatopsis nigrescens]|uniref:hypothetical protein n=1 Tax=Amycolatopsis nigrescens TaxID=381445 RepID=UPI00037A7317|nr:hypothetical protein [Amycolatopsis nigrescens]